MLDNIPIGDYAEEIAVLEEEPSLYPCRLLLRWGIDITNTIIFPEL